MRHGSIQAKGRRLQVELAESLALAFKLTIDAEPPTKVGVRQNGVEYVQEGTGDLRIRRSGQAGADVIMTSNISRRFLRLFGKPIHFECKNVETYDVGQILRKQEVPAWLTKALQQGRREREGKNWIPVVVVRQNRVKPLVFWSWSVGTLGVARPGLFIEIGGIVGTNMSGFLWILHGCGKEKR